VSASEVVDKGAVVMLSLIVLDGKEVEISREVKKDREGLTKLTKLVLPTSTLNVELETIKSVDVPEVTGRPTETSPDVLEVMIIPSNVDAAEALLSTTPPEVLDRPKAGSLDALVATEYATDVDAAEALLSTTPPEVLDRPKAGSLDALVATEYLKDVKTVEIV